MNVFIVFFESKTMRDIIGIYSTYEAAQQCKKKIENHIPGTSGITIIILERKLNE